VGSGIVWDSNAAAEYDECLLKGAVLGRRPVRFDLLETMRWTPHQGYFLYDRHLARLTESAQYFDFACDRDAVDAALARTAAGLTNQTNGGSGRPGEQVWRVRLLLSRDGTVRIETLDVMASPATLRTTLASEPVNEEDPFLFHKTTYRGMYERARVEGFDEVVLWNRRDEVTEGMTTNVIVELDGRKVTPPVACGLLAGTFRAELVERGEVSERRLTRGELRQCTRVWLVNSVYEWRTAEIVW
jgi:para-aminobenzoate synthetase/4-amino-4-deoxychorismate lyase